MAVEISPRGELYMKRLMSLLMTLLFVILTVSCGKWKEVSRTEKTSNDNYFAGAFSEDSIVSVGYFGSVSGYDKEEDKWFNGTNRSACLFGLESIDSDTYIACGNAAGVVSTVDRGKTWNLLSDFGASAPYQCRYASFSEDTVGWIASSILIGQTEDFGQEWKTIPFNTKANGNIMSVCNIASNSGYVFTVKGALFYTEDGGASWVKTAQVIDPKLTPLRNEFTQNKQTLHLRIKGEKGIIAFANETDEGYFLNIYNSEDGGKTWEAEAPIAHSMSTVYINRDMSIISTLNFDSTVSLFKK